MLLMVLVTPAVLGDTLDTFAGPDAPATVPAAVPFSVPEAVPVHVPVAAPVAAPVMAPVTVPETVPVATPVALPPVTTPVATPVATPPVAEPMAMSPEPVTPVPTSPVSSPVSEPMDASPESVPVAMPVAAPVEAPVAAPVVIVNPIAHCWEAIANTTTFNVYFGYDSESSEAVVHIAAGSTNVVSGTGSTVQVPTSFSLGTHSYAFTVKDVPAGSRVSWTLGTETAVIDTNDAAQTCARATGNVTVDISYNVAAPTGSALTTFIADLTSAIHAALPEIAPFTIQIVNIVATKRAPSFDAQVSIAPTTSGPSAIASAAALSQTSPAALAVPGFTPTAIRSTGDRKSVV